MAVTDSGTMAGPDGGDDIDDGSPTPHDDIFRTLIVKGEELRAAVVNEIIRPPEPITADAFIIPEANELFAELGKGRQAKRMTDALLRIGGKIYHLECQSVNDSTIGLRMIEYDMLTALRGARRETGESSTVVLDMPLSGILYLQSSDSTPRELTVRLNTRGGSVEWPMGVMRMADYTLDDLTEKGLVLLYPFHLWNVRNRLAAYEEGNPEARRIVVDELTDMLTRLNTMRKAGTLPDNQYSLITAMLRKEANAMTRKLPNARKELNNIMGGRILSYPGEKEYLEARERGRRDGLAEGRAEGKAEGRAEGRAEGKAEGRADAQREAAERMIRIGTYSDADIASILDMDMTLIRTLRKQQADGGSPIPE